MVKCRGTAQALTYVGHVTGPRFNGDKRHSDTLARQTCGISEKSVSTLSIRHRAMRKQYQEWRQEADWQIHVMQDISGGLKPRASGASHAKPLSVNNRLINEHRVPSFRQSAVRFAQVISERKVEWLGVE